MKKTLFRILSAALCGSMAFPATSPIYVNNAPLTVPPIVDATIFWNRSTFNVSTLLPYRAQHVQFWTNSGTMNGFPGFRFQYDRTGSEPKSKGQKALGSRNLQKPSAIFVNEGNIGAGVGFTTVAGSTIASVIAVSATNVINSGRLDGNESGIISISATNGFANLSRGGIRTGFSTGLAAPCATLSVGTNYTLDPNITELYWGAGRNNDLGTNGQPLDLPTLTLPSTGLTPSFALPFPSSGQHEVISRDPVIGNLTNLITLPGASIFVGNTILSSGCSGNYMTFVHTNSMNATSTAINVVFVPTLSFLSPTNLSVDVRFTPASGRAGTVWAPVVEFRNVDFDIVNRSFSTNYVTFVDRTGSETNVVLSRPLTTITASGARTTAATRRPNTYNIIRGRFCNFDILGITEPTNSIYDPAMFYTPTFATNEANTIYAAYAAQLGQNNSAAITRNVVFINGVQQVGVTPALSDPTNFTGRIEISANELDLSNTRLRAENFVSIKARNLTSNIFAQVDAPFVNFDVQSASPELVITNLAPDSVNRLLGQLSAWSAAWSVNVTNFAFAGTNILSTNMSRLRFHVLIVDNCLRSQQPVTLHRFAAKATNLVIGDNLFVNSSVLLDAPALTLNSGATLSLPFGTVWSYSNIQHLLNFTNNGAVGVSGGTYFGTYEAGHIPEPPKKKQKPKKNAPPVLVPTPLDNFINHGSISGAGLFVRATNLQNTGSSFSPATLFSSGGIISLFGSSVAISNATLLSSLDVQVEANDLVIANSMITAGATNVGAVGRGAIVISVTNSFGDFDSVFTNDWFVTGGVRIPNRPAHMGDLSGTRIYSTAGSFAESLIVWPGENRGVSNDGFRNNLALGRLVLDGVGGNLFRFKGAATNNALYVDYLELRNDATNYNFAVGVDPGFTIYFGDANVPPEKLDSISSGRLRWVSSFAGPQSSTNITYPNGTSYTFNAGLVRSKDIDSDGDGVVNAEDCTPLPVPGFDTTGAQCSGIAKAAAPRSKAIVSALADFGLSISLSESGQEVRLEWNAGAGSASALEYKTTLADGAWQSLTNFVNGPVNTRVSVKDRVAGGQRVYRVRVEAAK